MSLKNACIAGVILLISTSAAALPGAIEDLKNVCDHVASPKELRLINATALMVANDPGFIRYNASNNTYSITNEAFRFVNGAPVCEESPLWDEPYINASAARTGFLIAPDKIMTAPHAPPSTFTPNHWLIVFRSSKTSGEDPGCSNFTWENIPASNVYYPNGALANTYAESPSGKYDYAVIQLNRAVADRRPLRVRRSGSGQPGDLLVSAGYPNRGGEKFDASGVFVIPNASQGTDPFDEDLSFEVKYSGNDAFYNIHGLSGSSGSPIYNISDDVVESVISYGSSATFMMGSCASVAQREVIEDFNGKMVDIQDEIPRSEVLVRPMDYVTHILPTTPSIGVFSNSYFIDSARINGGEFVNIGAVVGPSGDPTRYPLVTATVASGGRLVPAGGLQFDINADAGAVSNCGIHDYELNVKDVTNDFNNVIRHHFEIGMREFSLKPIGTWEVRKLGAPYGETRIYTVSNVRPTPTHVMVSTYAGYPFQDFLRVNGGGSVSLDLGPVGSSTESASILVSMNQAAADSLPMNVVHRGRVSFYHQPFNCAVPWQGSYVNRDVSFLKGQQSVVSDTQPDLLPTPTINHYGDPIRFEFDISGLTNQACVKDINLTVGMPSPALALEAAAPTVKFVLTSPSGLSKVLWSENPIPSQSYVTTMYDEVLLSVRSIYLDDQVAPPLGGDLLGGFNGQRISGKWFLDVSTSSSSGQVGAGPARIEFARSDRCLGGGQ